MVRMVVVVGLMMTVMVKIVMEVRVKIGEGDDGDGG